MDREFREQVAPDFVGDPNDDNALDRAYEDGRQPFRLSGTRGRQARGYANVATRPLQLRRRRFLRFEADADHPRGARRAAGEMPLQHRLNYSPPQLVRAADDARIDHVARCVKPGFDGHDALDASAGISHWRAMNQHGAAGIDRYARRVVD